VFPQVTPAHRRSTRSIALVLLR